MNGPSLSELFSGTTESEIKQLWESSDVATGVSLLPAGTYVCHVLTGTLAKSSRKGTPSYKITFKVIEGEFAGLRLWHDIWLTQAAMSMAKRELARLGITSPEQLKQPLTRCFRCLVRVVVHKNDQGMERNAVKSFEVIGRDEPEADPFAPESEA